jgi:hypothetical protein
MATPNGAVLAMDVRAGDAVMPIGNDVEWMMHGWSV